MEEFSEAVCNFGARNTSPDSDGIPSRAWVLASSILRGEIRQLFDNCLSSGQFLLSWKEARMVLLRKEGKSVDSPSAYRPVCLLDKLLKHVLTSRLSDHLSGVSPALADCNYGFRMGCLTIDAIVRVKSCSNEVISRDGVALAVSLDIVNAFNILSWEKIAGAFDFHWMASYLSRIVEDWAGVPQPVRGCAEIGFRTTPVKLRI